MPPQEQPGIDEIDAVLAFWFGEVGPERWYKKDATLDRTIRDRFGALHARLSAGLPDTWLVSPKGCLAAVIVCDQFSRNMYRDDARAFAQDALARTAAKRALARAFTDELSHSERHMLYMPFMHSEDLDDQARSIALFTSLGSEGLLGYAKSHHAIVEKFGRFPHRNEVLGRASNDAEVEFLKGPGSSF